MNRFFPEIPENDYTKLFVEDRIFKEVLKLVRDAFIKWYDWDPGEILINQKNQNSINSYAVTMEDYPMFIHIDQLLESVTFNFMLVMLKWAKSIECDEKGQVYFPKLLFVLNEMAILGQLPAESGHEAILGQMSSDQQIQNLAADCHWAMMIFTAGHEMAHIYQMNTNPEYWSKHIREMEKNADTIGYDILLRLSMERPKSEVVMEEYTYLAPMTYMDMFDLVFFTDYILYGRTNDPGIHGTPADRKENLFELVDQEQYQFDTELGISVYQSLLDSYDRYYRLLPEYFKSGKVNTIIRTKQRSERESL